MKLVPRLSVDFHVSPRTLSWRTCHQKRLTYISGKKPKWGVHEFLECIFNKANDMVTVSVSWTYHYVWNSMSIYVLNRYLFGDSFFVVHCCGHSSWYIWQNGFISFFAVINVGGWFYPSFVFWNYVYVVIIYTLNNWNIYRMSCL